MTWSAKLLLAAALFSPTLAPTSNRALAAEVTAGPLVVSDVFARAVATPKVPGAGYLSITNRGPQPDRLTGASTPAANRVELHTMTHEGGVMRMRALSAIDLPAGDTVKLEPAGGLHLMLMGLKAPLKQGETITVTLTFEKQGKVEVAFPVAGPGAMAPPR